MEHLVDEAVDDALDEQLALGQFLFGFDLLADLLQVPIDQRALSGTLGCTMTADGIDEKRFLKNPQQNNPNSVTSMNEGQLYERAATDSDRGPPDGAGT